MDQQKKDAETPIGWKQRYSISNAQIDIQHRNIFDLIERIRQHAVSGNSCSEDSVATIKELVDYANTHFITEEAAMVRCGFPFMEQHMELHRRYRQEIATYIKRCKGEDATIAYDIYGFLKFWWSNHIIFADKQLAAYLNLETVEIFKKKIG